MELQFFQNHFLILAEPQIGKTGVYLAAAAQLRSIVDKEETNLIQQQDEDEEYNYEVSSDEDTEENLEVPNDGTAIDDFKSRVPHWQYLQDCNGVPDEIKTQSKYLRNYGTYK